MREAGWFEVYRNSVERNPKSREQGLSIPCNLPLNSDPSQPDCGRCQFMGGFMAVRRLKTFRRTEPEIQTRKNFVLQEECPSLVVDPNRTVAVYTSCLEAGRFDVQGSSVVQGLLFQESRSSKRRVTTGNSFSFRARSPFTLTDRDQTYTVFIMCMMSA